MTYAVVQDMLDRFDRPENPELTQLAPLAESDPVEADQDQIAAAATEASGEMDLYIGTRHTLPISGLSAEESADLTRICCDIARYRLWSDNASKEVRQRYEDALAFLVLVSKGIVRLGGADPGIVSAARATFTYQPRRLTRDTLSGII